MDERICSQVKKLLITTLFIFLIVGGGIGYCVYLNNAYLNNRRSEMMVEYHLAQIPGERFSVFKEAKKKLVSQAKSVLGVVSGEQIIFKWNKKENTFEEERRAGRVLGAKTEEMFTRSEISDLDNNSFPEEYFLKDGVLSIVENFQVIWQSSPDWWIDSYALADSNGDGDVEINLSVWKVGNYGKIKPIWISGDDRSIRNHFFIFKYEKGELKPVWQSSNLDKQNCEFLFEDVDSDGKQELVTIEGDYSDDWRCVGKYTNVWQWKDRSFFNDWRSSEGKFKNLRIEKSGKFMNIVVGSIPE